MRTARSPLRVGSVAFDVDGTVVDNLTEAVAAAEDILALFGTPVSITTRTSMREHFGRAALVRRFGDTGVMISLVHPLLMRIRTLADPAPVHPGLSLLIREVAAATGEPPTFITAGYADAATAALFRAGLGTAVVAGRENGSKTKQIARWAAERPNPRFVCDTVTDVLRCQDAGVQAVGVAWGYDPVSELEDAGALPVHTVNELRALLLNREGGAA